MAIDPNGNFVVVWRDEFLDGDALRHRRPPLQRAHRPAALERVPDQRQHHRRPAQPGDRDGRRRPFRGRLGGSGHRREPADHPASSGACDAANGTPIAPEFPVNTDARRPAAPARRRDAAGRRLRRRLAGRHAASTFAHGGTGENIRGRFYPANFPSASPASDPSSSTSASTAIRRSRRWRRSPAAGSSAGRARGRSRRWFR